MQRSFTRLVWIIAVLAATDALSISTCSAASPKEPANVEQLRESANRAAERGDYATLLEVSRQLAVAGDAAGQYLLGKSLLDDRPQAALKWIKLAAAQGYAPAQYTLGFMYASGIAVPQDKGEAAKWYQLAAAQGHEEAQYELGIKTRPVAPTRVLQPQRSSPESRQAQLLATLEQCNSAATQSYNYAWNANCARIHERELDGYYSCLQKQHATYHNDPFCGRIWQPDNASAECRLPVLLADSLKHDLERSQDLCMKAYELGSR